MNVPLEFGGWVEVLEQQLNAKKDRLLRMAFNVFDFNEDGSVCQLDMFALMKLYENEDEVFVRSYGHDFCRIVAALRRKQRDKGKQDWEIQLRLKNIERKV